MRKIIFNKKNSNKRLDKFLMEEVFLNSGETRGEIIRRIKNRDIFVNDKSVKPSYVLKENDIICIKISESAQKKIAPNDKIAGNLKIIYANQNFIILDKPFGIQVHPSFKEEKNTLVNGLVVNFPEILNVGDGSADSWMRPGIVHRLDKETSGIMIVARNQKSFDEFKTIFHNRKITKEYTAVVNGLLKDKSGLIKKNLARSSDYRKQVIAHKKTKTKTRTAVTAYEVIKNFSDKTLLRIFPKTGRTHQIRIHLAAIGHSVVGDKLYGLRKYKKADKKYKRHLLHAVGISFVIFGKKFSFSSLLPDDFAKIISVD